MSNCNQSKQGGCTCTPDLFEEEDRDLSHLQATYPAGRGEHVHPLPAQPAPVGPLPHGGEENHRPGQKAPRAARLPLHFRVDCPPGQTERFTLQQQLDAITLGPALDGHGPAVLDLTLRISRRRPHILAVDIFYTTEDQQTNTLTWRGDA